MWTRYNAFLLEPPELVVAWQDAETDARGWLVINSLRGGAAGGGTRMRVGANPREVGYLAKTMELKFALAGPSIGGAKSALDFDPRTRARPRCWSAGSGHRALPAGAVRHGRRPERGRGGFEVIPIIHRWGSSTPRRAWCAAISGRTRPAFRASSDSLDQGVKAPVAARARHRGRKGRWPT
jgi:hypothetical protein